MFQKNIGEVGVYPFDLRRISYFEVPASVSTFSIETFGCAVQAEKRNVTFSQPFGKRAELGSIHVFLVNLVRNDDEAIALCELDDLPRYERGMDRIESPWNVFCNFCKKIIGIELETTDG